MAGPDIEKEFETNQCDLETSEFSQPQCLWQMRDGLVMLEASCHTILRITTENTVNSYPSTRENTDTLGPPCGVKFSKILVFCCFENMLYHCVMF